jgi:cysteine desulfurase/selenocysteine lyase
MKTHDLQRIYLDNAATSFPKPESVYAAMDDYNRCNGAPIGRGAYRAAIEATAVVQRCRKKIADLLGAEGPERILFTCNCTDSLNLALHGLLQAGDHVITSIIDHNSVLRPVTELRRKLGIEVTHIGADSTGKVDPLEFKHALRPQTKLISLIHASNVTGTIQPVAEVGQIAREAGVLFLVDAAQTAGHLPIDLRNLPVDLLAGPGHKGLLGPLGTGFLYLRPGVESHLASFRQGGTGTRSEHDLQPESLPDKYESGNHNAPGLVGLEAAVSWLLSRGVNSVHDHAQALTRQLLGGLTGMPRLQLFGPASEQNRVAVVSLGIDGLPAQEVAAILDQSFGIETRAGLHCAPGAHRAVGSFDAGGTVRLSIGPFTTSDDIAAAIDAFRQIAGAS